MLSDQHGLLVSGKLRYDVGRLALEGCHEFGSHAVILKKYLRSRKQKLGVGSQILTLGEACVSASRLPEKFREPGGQLLFEVLPRDPAQGLADIGRAPHDQSPGNPALGNRRLFPCQFRQRDFPRVAAHQGFQFRGIHPCYPQTFADPLFRLLLSMRQILSTSPIRAGAVLPHELSCKLQHLLPELLPSPIPTTAQVAHLGIHLAARP